VRATAAECPRIPAEFLEEERRTMTEEMFAQEYGCEFQSSWRAVFDQDLIEAAFTDEIKPLG
jgi:hypothetical protein